MQRLTSRLSRRLGDERGATAAVFALILVPVLGFAAIAVDVGALYAEKARLQVAADAAAIAVAQDCSRGNCGDMLATAQALITANNGEGTAEYPVLSTDPLSVTVTGSTPKEHWFAPVLGHDATAVSATAEVGWGSPSRGTAVLPLTFSWCAFRAQTGGGLPSGTTEHVVKLSKSAGLPDCTGPSGNVVPGGFGFLATDGSCEVTSSLDQEMTSSTGNTPPSGCDQADFAAHVGRTVLLPIFDEFGGTGSNAWYRVYGYAAFTLTGYDFGGQYTTGKKVCGATGSDRCVTGYFTRFVELSDAWDYSPDAPSMGSSILRLIR
ncbi:pilus assembly protein TadG-related protein [Blastococcus sp. PRF04-17]|uniref:pilus assembly protein TadG-related protein n=1 Tax=Blastococcus sp. PRF04-17 TaxID=2933797 RepID=UPI001FF58758|nr:pilus assembly protein TadG-related protein [Blastococcus sp. PRF04-17]UOY03078.1 Tad domain-containing protein [Blastococcus sp. PRF04-17]